EILVLRCRLERAPRLVETLLLLGRERDVDPAADIVCERALTRDLIPSAALVVLRADRELISGRDELGRDAQSVAVPEHRALDDGVDVQRRSDVAQRQVVVLVRPDGAR